MQIRVHAQVVNPKTQESDTTNVFHFTLSGGGPVSPVMPKTYGGELLTWVLLYSLSGGGPVSPVMPKTYGGELLTWALLYFMARYDVMHYAWMS